jgi:hypothetical protein
MILTAWNCIHVGSVACVRDIEIGSRESGNAAMFLLARPGQLVGVLYYQAIFVLLESERARGRAPTPQCMLPGIPPSMTSTCPVTESA